MKVIDRIIQIRYHRNGIGGTGFHAVIFEMVDAGAPLRMVAAVFDRPGSVAVLEVHSLAGELGVTTGIYPEGNSWRGDMFETELRDACRVYQAELHRTLCPDSVQTNALEVPCPECAVPAGALCLDLRSVRGLGLRRDHPHKKRIKRAREQQ